jgi:murein DD-endopeptidase MepM/ murein hydrolase activator NlpD
MEYKIQTGDTLSALASKYGTDVNSLVAANKIADPNKIYAGQTLNIPEVTNNKTMNGADINASEIKDNLPEVNQAEPSSTTNTNANTILEFTTEQQKKIESEKKALAGEIGQVEGETATEALIKKAETRPTIDTETKRQQEMVESGATDLMGQVSQQNIKVSTIKGEVEKIDTQEQTEIDALENTGMSRGAIDREKTVIQRKYASQRALKNAELSAEAAILSAIQGNYAMAKGAATDAVNDYTYDYQQNVKTFDNLFSIYSDWVGNLDSKEQNILYKAAETAQNELDKTKEEKTNVMSLAMKYNAYGAGITINDSLNEAQAKASQVSGEAESQIVGSASEGYQRYNPATNTFTPITGGVNSGAMVSLKDGTQIDASTVEGIKALNTVDKMQRSEIEAYLDKNTKLTKSTINSLIGQARILDTAESETIDNIFNSYDESQLQTLSEEIGADLVTTGGGFFGTGLGASKTANVDAIKSYFREEYLNYRDLGYSSQAAMTQIKSTIKLFTETPVE